MLCQLCQCDEVRSFHHLIPRTLHSNKWFKKRHTREEMQQGLDVCSACHSAVHDLIPNTKELGRHYNTRKKLSSHPQIRRFLRWKRERTPSA